jgi:hypothetical protein
VQLEAHGELLSSARRGRVLLERRSQGQVSYFLLEALPVLGQTVRKAVREHCRINSPVFQLLRCSCIVWYFVLYISYPARFIPRLASTNVSGYYDFTAVVDIYNGRSNSWSTASLSEARGCPAATSLEEQSMALFAGGTRRLLKDSGEFNGARLKGIVCVI